MRTTRALAAAALAASLLACDGAAPDTATYPPPVAPDSTLPPTVDRVAYDLDTLARGLDVPWGIAFAPDGRTFITERSGAIRVVRGDTLDATPWATLDVHHKFLDWGPESGLLGIALAPDFATSRHVYVLASVWRTDGDREQSAKTRLWRRIVGSFTKNAVSPVKNQLVRFTEVDGRGTEPTVLVDDLPANHYHAGGAVAFGPDGKLYVSLGDAFLPPLARKASTRASTILRLNADGSVPADNPTPGSPVFVRGVRNSQAVVWLADGTMLAIDHGPTGTGHESGRAGFDELNVIRAGENYGWPDETGWTPGAAGSPLWVWRSNMAPAGLASWRAAETDSTATLFVAGLRGGIHAMELVRAGGAWRAVSLDTAVSPDWGRIRSLAAAPDGSLLVTTSNRDGRGVPRPDDDLILRLRLRRGAPAVAPSR